MLYKKIYALVFSLMLTLFPHATSVAETVAPLQGKVSVNSFTSRPYILGPNDIISILLPLVPELNQERVRILPDGKINIAPVGSVDAAGLTIEQLKDKLLEKYDKYLVNAQLSVNLVEPKPFIVQVTGAVLNPGVYELRADTVTQTFLSNPKPEVSISRNTPLLSNILVAAGGVLYDSDIERIIVRNSITHTQIQVNLFTLLQSKDPSQDIYLSAGDSVEVPKLPSPLAINEEQYRLFASSTFAQRKVPVKVYGSVNNPGLIQLDASQSLNVNSAIASAGGYMTLNSYPGTPPKRIYISRQDQTGRLATMAVDPTKEDTLLMPNDIVYVPEKPIPRIGKFFDFISRIAAPANNIAGAYNGWALMFNPTRYQIRIAK